MSLSDIDQLVEENRIEDALNYILSLKQKQDISLSFLVKELHIFNLLNKFQDTINQSNNLLGTFPDITPQHHFNISIELLTAYIKSGELNKANRFLEEYQPLVNLISEHAHEFQNEAASLYAAIGRIHYYQGSYKQAVESQKAAINLSSNNKQKQMEYQNQLAIIYMATNRLQEAERLYLKNLEYFSKKENARMICAAQNNLSMLYYNQGKYADALKYAINAYETSQKVADQFVRMSVINTLGNAYNVLGYLDLSLEYYHKGLVIAQDGNSKIMEATFSHNIANCLKEKREYEAAETYYLRVLNYAREEKIDLQMINSLSQICINSLYLERMDSAKKHLDELWSIVYDKEHTALHTYYYTKARYLIKKNTIQDLASAENLLKQVVIHKENDHQLILMSYFALIDLKIYEFKMNKLEAVLQEIIDIIKILEGFWKQENLTRAQMKVLSIKFLLKLLTGHVSEARQLIRTIHIESKRSGNLEFSEIAHYYGDLLADFMTSHKSALDPRVNLNKRKYYAELERLIEDLGPEKGEGNDVSEKPLLFLLINHSTKQSYKFLIDKATNYEFSANTLERLLVDIQIYLDDAQYDPEIIERFYFNHHLILFRRLNSLIYCLFSKGKSFSLFNKLDTIIELVSNSSNKTVLEEGDFLNSNKFLDTIISQVFDTDAEPMGVNFENPNLEYSFILHPVRFQIMKLLVQYYKIPRADLMKLLNISSSSMNRHVKQMEEEGLLSTYYEFSGDKAMKFIILENRGDRIYHAFKREIST